MEIVSRVKAVFAQIDQQVAAFQFRTGLHCPTGCGLCCVNTEVYTSAMEMMPAAHEIFCRGEAQFWMDRTQQVEMEGGCVFYQKKITSLEGHCGMYALRPSICRLFGFAAVRNRLGESALSTCKYLKKNNPVEVAEAITLQNEAPSFSNFSALIMNLDLPAARLIPINDALRQTLLSIGLRMQMAHNQKLSPTTAP